MKGLMMVLGCSALVLGTACSTVPEAAGEKPAAVELEPMERPVYAAATKFHQIDKKDGSERFWMVNNINDAQAYEAENHKGCSWTTPADLIAPAEVWANCSSNPDWHSGQAVNLKIKGNLWPLKAGNKATYSYNHVDANGKQRDTNTNRCEVKEPVNIEVAIGKVDAFKVVCVRSRDDWSETRVWYYSPEHKTDVKYIKKSSSKGVEQDYELTRIESI